MNREPPRTRERRGFQRRADAVEHAAAAQLAPGEEPQEQVAGEIGGEPDGNIDFEWCARCECYARQGSPGDGIRASLPADEVETVQGAKHADRRRRAHGREQGAVQHGEPEVLIGNAEPAPKERKQGNGEDHSADAAHHVQGEGETRRCLEIFLVAVDERLAAVADDQLPGLELAQPARRLGVAGDENQGSEQHDAKSAPRERERCDAADCRNHLRNRKIAAVLQQRTEMRVPEPVPHAAPGLGDPEFAVSRQIAVRRARAPAV